MLPPCATWHRCGWPRDWAALPLRRCRFISRNRWIIRANMDLNYFQITFPAFIRGRTEYLPISSSAHIILPRELSGWPDQGLVFDVAVHVGSLIAVVTYFRRDIAQLLVAWLQSFTGRVGGSDARLAWYLIAATIPAGVMGFLFNDMVETYSRNMLVIGTTSILFGILL